MKFVAQFSFFFFSLLLIAQDNCRSLEIKDVQNNNEATLSCSYPFNENGCINLHANFTDVKSTTEYQVESIAYQPYSNYNTGTVVSIGEDDKFSNPIDLPFNFCYFGNTYNKVIIGDNGLVSFDLSLAQGDSPFYSSFLPNPALYNNTIYGLYHDITNDDDVFGCSNNPATPQNECGDIRYQTVGTEPCRKFIISYDHMNHFNDENSHSTFQIVLLEASQAVEVHILEKPINNENSTSGQYRKNATIGIQNSNGSVAYAPSNRNNEIFQAQSESWRFSPSGSSVVTVNWYNQENNLIGTGNSIEICTDIATEIKAEAVFNYCNGNTHTESDLFPITFSSAYPRVENHEFLICDPDNNDNEMINLMDYANQIVNNPYTIEIYPSMEDARNGINMITDYSNYNLEREHTFCVKLSNSSSCYDMGEMKLTLINPPTINTNHIEVCDAGNDQVETVELNHYKSTLVGDTNVNVNFFQTEENATASVNPITSYTLTQNSTIFVRVDIENQCVNVYPLQLDLMSSPQVSSDIYADVCDNLANINLNNYLPQEIVDNYSDVQFYANLRNAENLSQPITNTTNFRLNNVSSLFIRINMGASCYSISELHFNYLASINTVSDVQVKCDSDIDGVETFNLNASLNDMTEMNNNISVTYFTTQNGAVNNDLTALIENPENYTLELGRHQVYVRFEDMTTGCVSIDKITLHVVSIPVAQQTEFEFCDVDSDNTEIVHLHSMDLELAGTQLFIETHYYGTMDNAMNNVAELEEIEVSPTATVFVKMAVVFEGEELCSDYFELQLSLITTPQDPITLNIDICDNNNDGKETVDLYAYQNLIFANSQIVNIQFCNNDGTPISNPSSYLLTGDTTILVRQRDNNNCLSPVNLVIDFNAGVDSKDILTYFCDEMPYNQEIINIIELIYQEMPTLNVDNIEVYKSLRAAQNQTANQRINNPENYNLTQSVIILYARLEKEGRCPSIIQIALKLTETPSAQSGEFSICDSNNDMTETIELSDYIIELFGTNSYNVAFYATESDLDNQTNPIEDFTIGTGNTTVYYIATQTGVATCTGTGNIQFDLASRPTVNNVTVNICDNNNDGVERYNLTAHTAEIINSTENYTFSYYRTEQNAVSASQAIAQPNNAEVTAANPIIWVRVVSGEGCYSIATIQFSLGEAPVVNNISIGSCDEDFNFTETFNLTSHISEVTNNASAYTVEYYTNRNGAIQSNTELLIANPSNYTAYNQLETVYVKVINPSTGCYSIANIDIEIYKIPKLIDAVVETCDSDFDGQYEINLTEIDMQIIEEVDSYEFNYFVTSADAQNNVNALDANSVYSIADLNVGVYVQVTNSNGCSALSYVTFAAGEVSNNIIPENVRIELCDDDFDGQVYFNLTEINEYITSATNYTLEYFTSLEDAQLQNNIIEEPAYYQNVTPTQFIYVRITEEGKCSTIGHFAIRVNALPTNPLDALYEKCPDATITLDAGRAESYLWSTGETTRFIEVTTPGDYDVELTNTFGCTTTYTTTVQNYALFTVNYNFTDQRTVVFSVIGDSQYEFSLDGENWQMSNVFMGLTQGVYDVYVRDTASGCIVIKPILVFDWVNIITPNSDGINDSWKECGLEVFGNEMSHLKIFDRYGKVVYQQSSNDCFYWNGKYMGRSLPTDTYWFKVSLPDGREFDGFIAIKNYNNGSQL